MDKLPSFFLIIELSFYGNQNPLLVKVILALDFRGLKTYFPIHPFLEGFYPRLEKVKPNSDAFKVPSTCLKAQ